MVNFVNVPCAFLPSLMTCILLAIPRSGYAQFSFTIVSDQRSFSGAGEYDSQYYFRGAVEAIKQVGKGAFIISPGDIDPPQNSSWTIEKVLGADFQWYPVVGNHELPGKGQETYWGENLEWLRSFDTDINGLNSEPDIISYGPSGCPETTYSFNFQNSHFVVLNEYCDATGDNNSSGDISDHLFTWLENDLSTTSQTHIFIFGHEPAYTQPDIDNGRFRHSGDGLSGSDNRNRFWNLLSQNGVRAYFCGHTHNFSAVKLGNVWQLDSGHARGIGDTGSPSTFLRINVADKITYEAFRDTHNGIYNYRDIKYTGDILNNSPSGVQSFQNGQSPSSSYSGTKDTTLSQSYPFYNFGSETTLFSDGDDPSGSAKDLSALLYWDITSIPEGSIIKTVSITLHITDITADDYQFHALLIPWVENQADWYRASYSKLWSSPGASGVYDRDNNLLGSYSPGRPGFFTFYLNQNGIDLVQSWVNNKAENNGIIVSNTLAANGINFSSSEAADARVRPKLTVEYSYLPELRGLPWLNLLLSK